MKERDVLIENLCKMKKHYFETQSKYKVQEYCRFYACIINKQVEILKGNICHPNWYFADTFGGGSLNGISDVLVKIENSTSSKFTSKL